MKNSIYLSLCGKKEGERAKMTGGRKERKSGERQREAMERLASDVVVFLKRASHYGNSCRGEKPLCEKSLEYDEGAKVVP